jgi:hypothetical protein
MNYGVQTGAFGDSAGGSLMAGNGVPISVPALMLLMRIGSIALVVCSRCQYFLGPGTTSRQPIQGWTLTTLREKLFKIGAQVVSHAKYLVFKLAEAAVPRPLFAAIMERIGQLRLACASG